MAVRKLLVVILTALLVGSLVPFALASGSENSTGTNEVPQEKVVAEKLIDNLKRLAEFTEAKVPENMTNSTYLALAEEHYNKALSEFQAGNYNASMVDALMAMHYYRLVLSEIGAPMKGAGANVEAQFRAQVERTRAYLRYAERLINVAGEKGLNVTEARELYNETLEAFKLVMEDVRSGNLTKAREDYEVALQKKAELDSALKELRLQMLYQNAEQVVERFLAKGERAIQLANRTLSENPNPELNETYTAFLELYTSVKTLADEGKWDEALNLIIEKRDVVKEFQMELGRGKVMARGHFKWEGNFEKLKELRERIVRDGRELMKLKREGVDVSKAEVQLKSAMNEYKLGIRLLRTGQPEKAKEHFDTAVTLLKEVEAFINAHS
ncbi:conserved exported protein of unknown function [Thermococcus nautili]|uniref:hypothetical protein n=1 Tax=Thermococcus nautili TaxID=195522 RepID=UPI0025534ECB|nr:hypothetical protein [Thermococcus nautili]CAI1493798.1 conserved exported protein of unknown function [Thermococcus nautili]